MVDVLRLNVHGLDVRIDSNDSALLQDLGRRLEYFRTVAAGRWPVRLSFETVDEGSAIALAPPVGEARVVYEPRAGRTLYFPERDELYVELPRLRMLLRPQDGEVSVVLMRGAEERWLATHSMIALAFMELLKRRGIFSLHSAGIEIGNRGLLLAGPNGAGKSTLTLALAEAASGFQGDDLVFVTKGPESVETLPFPDHVAATPETAALLPELKLHEYGIHTLPSGVRKHEFPIGLDGSAPIAPRMTPKVLVLIEPGDPGQYELQALAEPAVLAALAPNVLATETEASRRHLDTLGALVEGCRCYRLTGRGQLASATALLLPALFDEAA